MHETHRGTQDATDRNPATRTLGRRAERTLPDAAAAGVEGTRLLVVLDGREARIFEADLHGGEPRRITPVAPWTSHHSPTVAADDGGGHGAPSPASRFESMVPTLGAAEEILVLGSSTGAGSAMDDLVATLKRHHPHIARRVVGMVVVDEQRMAEKHLLAEARPFFGAS